MPTEKRQKYLARQAAKQANVYTREERQAEFDKVSAEFARLGLAEESFEEIKRFMDIARDWIETGTVYQGIIPIVGVDRQIVYTLTNNKRHPVGVMLQSTKPATSATPATTTITTAATNSASETSSTVATDITQQPSNENGKTPSDKPKKAARAPIISGPRHAQAAYRAPPTKVKAQSA